jgi:hypothetical protein
MSRVAKRSSLFSLAFALILLPFAVRIITPATVKPLAAQGQGPALSALQVQAALIRAGLDPSSLAAAGVSANQTTTLVGLGETLLASEPTRLSEADSAVDSARVTRDTLERKIQSGLATQQEKANYASAGTALAAAESDRADALASLFNAATASLNESQRTLLATIQATGTTLRGAALPLAESQSVLVVAPASEMSWWRSTIAGFDRPQPVTTLHYVPRRFGLDETAKLIEETVHPEGAIDATGSWRLVQDHLTGSLVITTTPAKHAAVQALFDRLEATEASPVKPVRSYPIRNRRVSEVIRGSARPLLSVKDASPSIAGRYSGRTCNAVSYISIAASTRPARSKHRARLTRGSGSPGSSLRAHSNSLAAS